MYENKLAVMIGFCRQRARRREKKEKGKGKKSPIKEYPCNDWQSTWKKRRVVKQVERVAIIIGTRAGYVLDLRFPFYLRGTQAPVRERFNERTVLFYNTGPSYKLSAFLSIVNVHL